MKFIGLTAFFLISALLGNAQNKPIENLKVISSYLRISHISNPKISKSSSGNITIIDNNKVTQNGLEKFFLDRSHQKSTYIAILINKMLAPLNKGGDEKLQQILASLLNITKMTIYLEFFADYSNAYLAANNKYDISYNLGSNVIEPGNSPILKAGVRLNHFWVLPHASGNTIRLGETYLIGESRSDKEKVATILHEVAHTQEESEFSGHFGDFYYGNDYSHSRFELLANFNTAFKEGIANAFAFAYLRKTPIQAWNLFNQKVYYEIVPRNVCKTIFNDCLDSYFRSEGKKVTCSATDCCININELSTPVMLHNEYVQASIFFGFSERFGIEALCNILKVNYSRIKNQYCFPIVYEAMMDHAKFAQLFSSKDKLPIEYYPIALLDYATNWGLKDIGVYQESLRRM